MPDNTLLMSVTKLAATLGALYGLSRMMGGDYKEGARLVGLATLFLMVPEFIQRAVTVTASEDQYTTLAENVGSWYGGGTTSSLIKTCMVSGAQYGQQIWDVLTTFMIPQAGLLWCGILAWMRAVKGDSWALPIFIIMAGILAPLVAGGPAGRLPNAVVNGASEIVGALIEKNSTRSLEATGYGIDDFRMARASARLPIDLRPALITYQQAAKGALRDSPVASEVSMLDPEADDALATSYVQRTYLDPELAGPADNLGPPFLRPYYAGSLDPKVRIWTWPINAAGIWQCLSDDKGRLRDRLEWGDSTTIIPLGSGDGSTAASTLRANIQAVYDAYNDAMAGKTIEEIKTLLAANYIADGATTTDEIAADIERRATALQKANIELTRVNPPEVIDPPKILCHLVYGLRKEIQEYYRLHGAEYVRSERIDVLAPGFLTRRDFYGSFLFGGDLGIPVDDNSTDKATLQAWTAPSKAWTAYLSAPGVVADFGAGYGRTTAADAAGTLDDQGFFSKLFYGVTMWTGLELISTVLKVAVPFCKYVVPWVAALAFFFLMVSYPIFAATSFFPGRWQVMFDWARSVMWVMSWAFCYHIGRAWMDGGGPPLDLGDASWFQRRAATNIWEVLGVIMILAAPAFTTVVLGASASAMQNIGGSLMSMGMRLAGASAMLGSIVMVAVTAGVAKLAAIPIAAASGASASAGAAGAGAAGAGAAGAGAAAQAGSAAVTGASVASTGGSLASTLSGAQQVASAAMQAGRQASQIGSMAMQRIDSLLPNPMTGQSGGTGSGAGGSTFGPTRLDEGRRFGSHSQGRPAARDAGPGVEVTSERSPAAQQGLSRAASNMGSIAQAADAAVAGGDRSPSALRRSEEAHGMAATYSHGSPLQAAHHASHAAAAAIAGGAPSAPVRLAAAERASAAAVAAAIQPSEQLSAHMSSARTQIAKGDAAAAEGRQGDAQASYSQAVQHLAAAQSASAVTLSAATSSGDQRGRADGINAQIAIGATASALGSRMDGGSQLSTIQAQAQAAIQASGGAPVSSAGAQVASLQLQVASPLPYERN